MASPYCTELSGYQAFLHLPNAADCHLQTVILRELDCFAPIHVQKSRHLASVILLNGNNKSVQKTHHCSERHISPGYGSCNKHSAVHYYCCREKYGNCPLDSPRFHA